MRARVTFEENRQARQQIVVTEIPYMVNKARLAEKIAALVNTRKIADIADIRDESSKRGGMRLVVILKKGANPHVVLNQLYKHTQLQDTFGVNMVSLVDGVPRTLGLQAMIRHYIDHQVDVTTKRTRYQLRKAQEQDHLVQGYLIALANIDEVIAIIRGSEDTADARANLMGRFELSEIQANAILDMPLKRLTRLSREELERQHQELLARIAYLGELLADPAKLLGVVKEELLGIRKKYADVRRTEIRADEGDFDIEDLIQEQDVIITVTRAGYVKRMPMETYRRQGRGGKGVIGGNLKEDDIISQVFTTTTHHWLLVFTNKGRVYRAKVHEVPEATRQAAACTSRTYRAWGSARTRRSRRSSTSRSTTPDATSCSQRRRAGSRRHGCPSTTPPRIGARRDQPGRRGRAIGTLLTDGKDDLILSPVRVRPSGSARPRTTHGPATAGVIGMKLRPGTRSSRWLRPARATAS